MPRRALEGVKKKRREKMKQEMGKEARGRLRGEKKERYKAES